MWQTCGLGSLGDTECEVPEAKEWHVNILRKTKELFVSDEGHLL